MGGGRQRGAGQWVPPLENHKLSFVLVRTSLEKQFDPPPLHVGIVWIRACMSDGGIIFLHVAGLAIILSRVN